MQPDDNDIKGVINDLAATISLYLRNLEQRNSDLEFANLDLRTRLEHAIKPRASLRQHALALDALPVGGSFAHSSRSIHKVAQRIARRTDKTFHTRQTGNSEFTCYRLS